MKVFKLNDLDWWAGDDLESVKAAYMAETGMDAAEAFDDPRECTEQEMRENEFYQGEPGAPETTVSFAQQLENMIGQKVVTPCVFAVSEY